MLSSVSAFLVLYIISCLETFSFALMQPVISEIRKELGMEPFLFGLVGKFFRKNKSSDQVTNVRNEN